MLYKRGEILSNYEITRKCQRDDQIYLGKFRVGDRYMFIYSRYSVCDRLGEIGGVAGYFGIFDDDYLPRTAFLSSYIFHPFYSI